MLEGCVRQPWSYLLQDAKQSALKKSSPRWRSHRCRCCRCCCCCCCCCCFFFFCCCCCCCFFFFVVVAAVSVSLPKRMFASKTSKVPSSLDDNNYATSEVRLRSRRESAQLASPWLTWQDARPQKDFHWAGHSLSPWLSRLYRALS